MENPLEKLTAEFQKDLDREKKNRKENQHLKFGLKLFQRLGKYGGYTSAKARELWDDSQEDPPYDIKLQFPEVSHVAFTGVLLSRWQHLLLPAREIPHGLWDKYRTSLKMAMTEYDRSISALVFRLPGNVEWVMTNENLTVPQLQPVVQLTTPSGVGDIRIMPMKLYEQTWKEKIL